jgi:hypothetical protein
VVPDGSKESRAFVFSGEAITYQKKRIFNYFFVQTSNFRFLVLYRTAFTTVATGPNLEPRESGSHPHSLLAQSNFYIIFQSKPTYRTIVLPFVLYKCEIWSVTLREEHRLRVIENRVLRTIFWPERDEVTGE